MAGDEPNIAGFAMLPFAGGETIYNWFEKGAGPSQSTAQASGSWRTLASSHNDIAEIINKAVRDSGAAWEGQAGDAARSTTSPLATWADMTGKSAQDAGKTADGVGEAYVNAKYQMQKPPEVPDKPFLNDWAPWDTDYDKAVEKNQQVSEQNIRAFNQYAEAVNQSTNQMPTFISPDATDANMQEQNRKSIDKVGESTQQPPSSSSNQPPGGGLPPIGTPPGIGGPGDDTGTSGLKPPGTGGDDTNPSQLNPNDPRNRPPGFVDPNDPRNRPPGFDPTIPPGGRLDPNDPRNRPGGPNDPRNRPGGPGGPGAGRPGGAVVAVPVACGRRVPVGSVVLLRPGSARGLVGWVAWVPVAASVVRPVWPAPSKGVVPGPVASGLPVVLPVGVVPLVLPVWAAWVVPVVAGRVRRTRSTSPRPTCRRPRTSSATERWWRRPSSAVKGELCCGAGSPSLSSRSTRRGRSRACRSCTGRW
ncbi:hypothetical protein BBK82_05450 [Lentzea guizhouensis]|uniref:PPE domain-containing protein n=1 Tax=Lentzea guizhouensis TaxID=1586287 RepID=A0A1B2HCZ5_9PSEU|nr:PPE domain-containing protein [Lentzea guizhouensis]ANZ35607.1 hypothetical protein BBK82_05450 [Lentzea guizhouensis]